MSTSSGLLPRRVRRFALGNRAVVTLTALAFAGLVASLLVVMVQQRQLRRSCDALTVRSTEAEALLGDLRQSVSALMTSCYVELAAIPGTRRVLDRIVRATAAVAEQQGDPALLVEAVRAQSLHAANLWRPFLEDSAPPEDALKAHERARDLALALAASHPADAVALIAIAEARVSLLIALGQCGRFDEALAEGYELESWLRENMVCRPQPHDERTPEREPEYIAGFMAQIAIVQSSRAHALCALGRFIEADAIVTTVLRESQALADRSPVEGIPFERTRVVRGTDQFALDLIDEAAVNLVEGAAHAPWIPALDATETSGSLDRSVMGLLPASIEAERAIWRALTPVSRARHHQAAARLDLGAKRPTDAARHGRRAVEILERALAGRKLAWVESDLLRSLWLTRGRAHAANGERLAASRFLGLALASAEEALAREPRDLAARGVAIDAAIAFARLESEIDPRSKWLRRARNLLARAVCDAWSEQTLASRKLAIASLLDGR